MAKLEVNIEDFNGGLAPAYWESDYPRYGNKNMAGKARAVDLVDPSYLREGLGRTMLTDGDASVKLLILDEPTAENETYAVEKGGRAIYKISGDTLSKEDDLESGAEATAIAYYKGDIWFTYDHSGDARLAALTNLNSPETGLAKGVPHRMVTGGLDILVICNGSNFAKFDGSTLVTDALELPDNHVLVDLQFTRQNVMGVTNTPAVTDGARSSIFLWDTESTSWTEYPFRERINSLFTANGGIFVHYNDLGRSRLGMMDGQYIKPLAAFDGDSPSWHQVAVRKGFITWIAGGDILCWGAPESWMEAMMFPVLRADSGHSYNSVAAPFGYLITNSDDGSDYLTEKADGYTTQGYWKSILFSTAGVDKNGVLSEIIVRFNKLPDSKSFTVKLVNAQDTELYSKEVSETGTTKFEDRFSIVTDTARIEIHFDDNSSDTVEISSIILKGNTRT